MSAAAVVVAYPAPASGTAGAMPATDVSVTVDGQPIAVARCLAADYAGFSFSGAVEIVVTSRQAIARHVVRPAHRGVDAKAEGRELRFRVDRPRHLYVEIDGNPPLCIFANPLETGVPAQGDPGVVWFGPGVHDAGEIELTTGQTLYLAGGAIVRGSIHAVDAERVSVRGRGVLDGSHFPKGDRQLVVFEHCRDVLVEGIATIGTPSWNLVIGACQRVHIDNVKLIGWVVSSDGIDVVGSTDVLIENCFLRNNDDCIAVKAIDLSERKGRIKRDWRADVARVRVRACVMYNDHAGNALEIGFETRTASISDIVFSDIDVIGAHGEGGVFTIHNGDRAVVSNVRYEDIRVEHFYDKLVDIRVLHSRYSKDHERGRIRDIHFKDIQIIPDLYNTPSLIGGMGPANAVEGVVFENVRIGDTHVGNADHLHLFSNVHSSGVSYR